MPDNGKPTCFVVMGFGRKTDFATGRTLDLDKTYKYIIKPAAEEAGYECIRADEIQHAGVIDVPMYERLLNADLVIADLSTSNVNAFFELGVRYALRPRTTIVIVEEGFKNPFDTNHISFRRYRHDGEALDIEVVEDFKPKLQEAIKAIVENAKSDSPVYTFLPDLSPPSLADALNVKSISEKGFAAGTAGTAQDQSPQDAELAQRTSARLATARTDNESSALRLPMAALMEQAQKAREAEDFAAMRGILEGLRFALGENVDDNVLQQLAFATYSSKTPDAETALDAAKDVLAPLNPESSLDPETIGLWAAVHKRLAELPGRPEAKSEQDLNKAIAALERGFHLKHDYYNGINLAYLLNVRAARSTGDDAIADHVAAGRIRQKVIAICHDVLEHRIVDPGKSEKQSAEEQYWVRASLAEAYAGLGDEANANEHLDKAKQIAPPPEDWMISSTETQIGKLKALIAA